ncbi:ubiquinone anaerobic biosynthesis accessory factor UbiT [Ruegeria sp. MALMAid1280]|uniref:ubiquinone anaerobic biosynthesis accessory factor UbiT n=1 Tax=Ruegeria sp. MALMAid1280 TaxID=3411634 RepID=UPI003BA13371
MSQSPAMIPRLPQVVTLPLRILPYAPLSAILSAFSRKIAQKHPGMFRRLGEHDHTRFILDPTDLPFVICLDPNGGTPRVTVTRGSAEGAARIAGPLAALLGLVHGAYDGDALFFSRDLVIEGDTAAALALRNAVDDAELDFAQELSNLSGPLAQSMQRVLALIERRTGVNLSRPEEADLW